MEDVGDRIKRLRQQRKLSQAELGARVGVGSTQISMIESGKSNGSLPVIAKIADVLSATYNYLVDGKIDDIRLFPDSPVGVAITWEAENAELIADLKALDPRSSFLGDVTRAWGVFYLENQPAANPRTNVAEPIKRLR